MTLKVEREIYKGDAFWTEPAPQEPADIMDPAWQRVCLDAALRQLRGQRVEHTRCELAALKIQEANAFLEHHHRHSRQVTGWKFGMGLRDHLSLVGVAVVGRPVARRLDDGETLEVTRLCTLEGEVPNVASRLLGACGKTARQLGYRRMITYTHADENGASLRAAGYTAEATTAGGSWSRASRARADHELEQGPKTRWTVTL